MNRRQLLGGALGTAALAILPTQATAAHDHLEPHMREIQLTEQYIDTYGRDSFMASTVRDGYQVLLFRREAFNDMNCYRIHWVRKGLCHRSAYVRVEQGSMQWIDELLWVTGKMDELHDDFTIQGTMYFGPRDRIENFTLHDRGTPR